MFELHIPSDDPPVPPLGPDRIAAFADPDRDVTAFSLIPWAEHCTECAFPSCYRTCDLYEPRRPDGHCRRFIGGMAAFAGAPTLEGQVVGVAFKRWGKLMAFASTDTVPAVVAAATSRAVRRLDSIAAGTADRTVLGRPGGTVRLEKRFKAALSRRFPGSGRRTPDYFLLEVLNPGDAPVTLTLTVRPDGPAVGRWFQHLVVVEPGLARERIDFAEIAPSLAGRTDVQIELTPNIDDPEDEGLVLYFGTLAFVNDRRWAPGGPAPSTTTASGTKTVKVVAWDLDNTVWDGVLVEDRSEGIRLQHHVRDLVVELDRRGIVNTVVSKNDHEPAMAELERFGLADYVVFPKIGWGPKSASLRAAIEDFNVGADTVVFVDDQPFERAEVAAALPSVRVLGTDELDGLLDRPEFSPPVTADSSRRRQFYRDEEARAGVRQHHADDYEEFLRSCNLRLELIFGARDLDDRIHELVQRTNQMNFSGSKYRRDELERYLDDDGYDHVVMRASDRFGDYGIIGFALIRREGPVLWDLTFSCRVQSKRVEHAFLAHLLHRARAGGASRFEARYRRTDRNQPVAAVFDDLRFELAGRDGDEHRYAFDLDRSLPTVDVVTVAEVEHHAPAPGRA